jgi:signal transduction histidine kinase
MEKINILIIDDRPENIVALEALLDWDEVNIISTTKPNEALRICWEMDIAIAMVDVQMPEMDGFELVEILKSNPKTKDILILFVTAISKDTKYAVKGLNTGAVDYLYKPLDPFVTSAKVGSFIQFVKNQREIKRKNQELESYQKELIKTKEEAEVGMRIRENFLASMSHEIRTPINGIIGVLGLLKDTSLTEEQVELTKLIRISSVLLLGVINDILDLSKIEAGKFKICRSKTDLVNNCNEVINLLRIHANEKNLELFVEFDKDLPVFVMADSLRLNQILMNLITNAIKFVFSGSVTLKVCVLENRGNERQIQFCVSDTGIGIAAENIDKIFDVFEQADEQTTIQFGGTGLGLNIVKNLAELKGGTLYVESEEGVGSRFYFTNWYEVIDDENEQIPKTADLQPFENVKVLVAEDNSINAFVVKKILEEWNIDFKIVENGKEALEAITGADYDLVLMDTFMPVMNGLETIKLIREGHTPGKENIPIISFSSAVMDRDKETALKAGANDVIGKPFELHVLHKMITSYTSQKNPSQ